jgi:ribonuclease HI
MPYQYERFRLQGGEKEVGHWDGQAFNLGTNKEVFDAELNAIFRAMVRFAQRRESHRHYTIFADAQAALQRCADDTAGPGQAIARQIIGFCYELGSRGNTVTLRWVPGNKGVPGNEKEDAFAKLPRIPPGPFPYSAASILRTGYVPHKP